MIRFQLICDNDHKFDSWFRSGTDCDGLLAKKMVNCTTCGSDVVRKAMMAPTVSTSDSAAVTAPRQTETPLERFKKEVESKADDVGKNFAKEARDMHAGTIPERPIYGQATGQEAKALLSEGVPVMPLPFIPTKKTN